MGGVIRSAEWRQTREELYERYRLEADIGARKRLQVLWLVRSGESARAAAERAGVGEHTKYVRGAIGTTPQYYDT